MRFGFTGESSASDCLLKAIEQIHGKKLTTKQQKHLFSTISLANSWSEQKFEQFQHLLGKYNK